MCTAHRARCQNVYCASPPTAHTVVYAIHDHNLQHGDPPGPLYLQRNFFHVDGHEDFPQILVVFEDELHLLFLWGIMLKV